MGSRTSSNGSLNTTPADVNGGHANLAAKAPAEAPQQVRQICCPLREGIVEYTMRY